MPISDKNTKEEQTRNIINAEVRKVKRPVYHLNVDSLALTKNMTYSTLRRCGEYSDQIL